MRNASWIVVALSSASTSYVIDGRITIKGDDDPMMMKSHIAAKRVAETCKPS